MFNRMIIEMRKELKEMQNINEKLRAYIGNLDRGGRPQKPLPEMNVTTNLIGKLKLEFNERNPTRATTILLYTGTKVVDPFLAKDVSDIKNIMGMEVLVTSNPELHLKILS